MSVERNKRTLERGAESFNNASDRSGWIEIHDPGVVAHGLAPEPLDRDGMAAFYSLLWSAFPDLRITVDDMVGEGDEVAWRLTVRGTHEGEFRGIAPTGVNVTFGAQYIFRFRDGAIVERWTTFDRLGVMVQLGAIPAPVRRSCERAAPRPFTPEWRTGKIGAGSSAYERHVGKG